MKTRKYSLTTDCNNLALCQVGCPTDFQKCIEAAFVGALVSVVIFNNRY